jgi:alpha-galactosidase
MQFGLWVEPEMVNPDSRLYRAHPDWVYQFPGRFGTEARNQFVLDLSRDDVVQYIQSTLDNLLKTYDISYLKWDMNRPLSEPGSTALPLTQQKEVWVRHVQGVYRILAFLRKHHPHVSIETCSGGGGRVDLGVLQYTDQFWPSDNTDAYDRLRIQEGVSYIYPACAMRAWVTDSPQFVNRRAVPLTYRFHVAMMGALGIGSNISEWGPDERAEAKQLIALYKDIRHVVAFGDQYRIWSATFGSNVTDRGHRPGDWSATQFVAQDQSEAILFLAGRGAQYADLTPVFHIEGLNPETLYTVELLSIHTASPQDIGLQRYTGPRSGTAWREMGLQLWLQGDYPSAIVKFRAVQ